MQYGDYKIVRYTPEYQDGLLDLLSLLWRAESRNNLVYFKWKYEQNPYADRYWIYLALYNEQPVAVRGNFAMRWQVGDPAWYINCLCDADAVTNPDHRRKGLLDAFNQLNLKDLEASSFRYIVTLSANAKSAASVLKHGWQVVGPVQPFIRSRPLPSATDSKLRNPFRNVPLARKGYTALRNVFRRAAPPGPQSSKARSSFDTLDNQKSRLKKKYPHLSIEDTARPLDMADLIAQLPANGKMRHVRDAEYFAWRYLNPRSSYRFLFWGEQPLDGYLILQTPARAGLHPVTIVDWEACNKAVLAQLLKAVLEFGDFNVLKTWGISLTAQAMELLLQSGFVGETSTIDQETYKQEILLRPAAQKPQEADWQAGGMNLLDLLNWDIRPIYSDTF